MRKGTSRAVGFIGGGASFESAAREIIEEPSDRAASSHRRDGSARERARAFPRERRALVV